MSNEAINWALEQPVSKSSAKFVLVAMANLAGAEMTCWPSYRHLTDATCQDVKTVEAGLRRLREAGFISDTGQRKGATGQVIVYQLNTPEFGGLKPQPKTPEIPDNTPKNGAISKVEKTPVFPGNTPVFPGKDPQISHETPPKTGDGTIKDTLLNPQEPKEKRRAFDASLIELPEWLERTVWQRWVRDRKQRNKPITEEAARLQVKKLAEHLSAGYSPDVVIDNAIENSWQGLYEPKNKPKTATKHTGFATKNYREGVSADGSLV